MHIRRYYKKGRDYNYTINEKFLQEMKDKMGEERANHIDNASYEIILDTVEEEKQWFNDCCLRVIENPRYYLDNLDSLPTFKVAFSRVFDDEKPKDI